MRREQGFSIIELLIVVAIIGIIASIAVPALQKARTNAQAGSAIQSLRTISTAENLYERRNRVYATLADLAPEGTLDASIQSGAKSGYLFAITLPVGAKHFDSNADPLLDVPSAIHFFVDDTAVIRFNEGAPADVTSDPIPR
jgi:prepilin-type N-terminal cleavage/methylation domain-containing protein